ncbi:MAG: hypothetical protein NT015_08375 [Alphaproteobacteria bacterium]|nr:hypothetical protein [Alphaproteobacteria bacterium]
MNEQESLSALCTRIEGLLRKSGAKGECVPATARAIIEHALIIFALPTMPAGGPRYADIFENAVGKHIVALPESRKVFRAVKQALQQARRKLARFQDAGLYAQVYREQHKQVLTNLIGDLERVEALSASRDGGGPTALGFHFFAAVALEWKHASGRFPPISEATGRVHHTLVELVAALFATGKQRANAVRGMSAETFQDAIAAVRREWRERQSMGEPPPGPKFAYALKRPERKRKRAGA